MNSKYSKRRNNFLILQVQRHKKLVLAQEFLYGYSDSFIDSGNYSVTYVHNKAEYPPVHSGDFDTLPINCFLFGQV